MHHSAAATHLQRITAVRLPERSRDDLFDLVISDGTISSILTHQPSPEHDRDLTRTLDAAGGLCVPSFCHSHVHLDKCFILSDPKYSDLEIVKGDFAEALALTNKAKGRFEEEDLLRRGRRLIEESIQYGVTCMRAFVEVDELVDLRPVNAALTLKEEWKDTCDVQICAFAQLALFSGADGGMLRRKLMYQALANNDIDVIGSTPYVEEDAHKMKSNVAWTIRTALEKGIHLDFQLDYNLDGDQDALVWFVLQELKEQQWLERASRNQVITFGHCTRLTLFSENGWSRLKKEVGDLPVHFVGLPTSDLFMMGRPCRTEPSGKRQRGTLQIVDMIGRGFNCATAINNIGNAFTPQGSCNLLRLANLGLAVYQTGAREDVKTLFDAVTINSKAAIGLSASTGKLRVGDPADLVVFECSEDGRSPKDLFTAVTLPDNAKVRACIKKGRRLV